MRGDKSFAYDLFVPHRRVSSRVVLLLRSTERKRSRPRFVESPIDLQAGPGCRGGRKSSAAWMELPGRLRVRCGPWEQKRGTHLLQVKGHPAGLLRGELPGNVHYP
jgi:hypothetical protein